MYACPTLRAKVYVADAVVLAGSANATAVVSLHEAGSVTSSYWCQVDAYRSDVSRVLAEAHASSLPAKPVIAGQLRTRSRPGRGVGTARRSSQV